MANIAKINQFLQDRLNRSGLDFVVAVEAAAWLNEVGLLTDSATRRGKPLRDLLRSKKIVGQRQESNRRWYIDRVQSESQMASPEHKPNSQIPNSIFSSATPHSTDEVLPDILVEGLRVVFIGTAVGNKSAQKQHYYSDPRNSFYREIYRAGLTPKLLPPEDDRTLITYGIGLTDIIKNVHTSNDATLDAASLSAGTDVLRRKLAHFKPTWICFNGKTAYLSFTGHAASYGPTGESIEGCHVFIVPSTSGRVSSTQTMNGRTRSEWFGELAAQLSTS